MTEKDIREIETDIGKKLPTSYKSLLLNYPQELLDEAGKYQIMFGFILPAIKENIIRINKQATKNGFTEESRIVIGEDGCGGYYFIDLTDEGIYEFNCDDDPESYTYLDEERIKIDLNSSLSRVHDHLDDYICEGMKSCE